MENPKPPPSYLSSMLALGESNERVENLELITAGPGEE